MAENIRTIPFASKDLKSKLIIAFSIMSVLPLLVCIYLVSNYILPEVGFKIDIAVILMISISIAFSGFLIIKEIFGRVLSITNEARLIAEGDLSRKLEIKDVDDEVNELSKVLNQLTQRLLGNMEELDRLMNRIEKLEIKDPLTGLYNEGFIRNRLNEEIRRAVLYHRPCSFIILDIDNFRSFHQNFGLLQSETVLKKISALISESITEIDRAARFGDDSFAVLLPEKNKRTAQEVAEGIRKKIEDNYTKETDSNKRVTISAGVSENPIDGINADELITKATEYLGIAKQEGKNRIAY
jgi:diguanylate cyclase (GGDEF)-like protein